MRKKIHISWLLLIGIAVLLGACNKITTVGNMEIYPAVLDGKETTLLQRVAGNNAKIFEYQTDTTVKSYELSLLRLREDKKWEKIEGSISGNFKGASAAANLLINWPSASSFFVDIDSEITPGGGITMNLDGDYLDGVIAQTVSNLDKNVKIKVNEPIVLQARGFKTTQGTISGAVGNLQEALDKGKEWDKGYLVVICFYDKQMEEKPSWSNPMVGEASQAEIKTQDAITEQQPSTEGKLHDKEVGIAMVSDNKAQPEIKVLKNARIPAEAMNRVITSVNVGDLDIYPADGKDIEVQYYIQYASDLTEEEKQSLDNLILDIQQEKTGIYFEVIPEKKQESYKRFFDQSILSTNKASLKSRIGLPSQIVELGIQNNVGVVNIRDIAARLQLEVNVGEAKITNFTPIKGSLISVNVGEVEYGIKDLSKAYELLNEVNVGSIHMRLPEGAQYKVSKDNLTDAQEDRIDDVDDDFEDKMEKDKFGRWIEIPETTPTNIINDASVGEITRS